MANLLTASVSQLLFTINITIKITIYKVTSSINHRSKFILEFRNQK